MAAIQFYLTQSQINLTDILSFKFHVLSFDIINIYIITLESLLKESFHHGLIYYTIEIHTYKY